MSQQQKIPLARTLPQLVERGAADEIGALGLALPGHVVAVSGAIVTVAFDVAGATLPQVTMPVSGSQYVRLPIQVGDIGVAVPASVYLGGASGLGGGVATLYQRGNLSSLIWQPIGNKNWSAVNADYVVVQGQNGVQIQDLNGAVVATFDKTAGVSVTFGSGTIGMNSSGVTLSFGSHSVSINDSGVTIDGILWDTHGHTGVTTGTGTSGGPVAT